MLALASAPAVSPRLAVGLSATCRSLAAPELLTRAAAWARLVAEAEQPNPYFTPHVVGAHHEAGLLGRCRAIAASRGDRLLALLPYRRAGAWVGLSGLANVAWSSPYTPGSTPLVARDDIAGAVPLLLDGLAAAPGRLWLLPRFSLESAVGRAVLQDIRRRGWPSAVLDPFERAVLDAKADHAAFLAGLDSGRRKDLRRRRRRLEESGEVRYVSAQDGPGLAAGVEGFLALEAAGWKGRSGTALASHESTARLARALFGRPNEAATPRSDLLTLDGRPVAASLALVCGGTAYLLKSAYDESLSRVSPGVLLEEEIVRSLHETRFASRLDSASAAGSHLDVLYPDRESIGDLLLATSPAISEARLAGIARAERARRAALARAKAFYRRVRQAPA